MRSLDAITSSFQIVHGKLTLLMGRPALPTNIARDLREAKKQIRQHQEKFPSQDWVTDDIQERLDLIAREVSGLKAELLDHKKRHPNITSQELRSGRMEAALIVLDVLTREAASLESIERAKRDFADLQAVAPDRASRTLVSSLNLGESSAYQAQLKELKICIPDDINVAKFLDIRDNSLVKMRKVKEVDVAEGGHSLVCLCEVVEADAPRFGWTKVAYKELRAKKIEHLPDIEKSERMDKRLEREKRAWEGLRHPNIAPLLGYVENPHWGLVSPWYENGHILNYLGKKPEADILRMLRQVSDAVAYLHENELIHGDLRSPNIMVDDHGEPIVIDFGNTISPITVTKNGVTTSVVPGVIRWMAPERVGSDEHCRPRNLKPTFASDTYSFGCLCIEVITRVHPFAHWAVDSDLFYARERHVDQPTVDPALLPAKRDACDGLSSSDSLWDMLNDCWQQRPDDRPSMRSVEQRLSELLNTRHST